MEQTCGYVRAHEQEIRNLPYLSEDSEETEAMWSDGSSHLLSGYETYTSVTV
jgi:hypothetical protein